MSLKTFSAIPAGFWDAHPATIHALCPGPWLLELPGEIEEPLFVSTLLHGNETTGFYALQRLLKKYEKRRLPRRLLVLIGNTAAAAVGSRYIDGQCDFNRIWRPGTPAHVGWAADLLERLRKASPLACVDIHNNTGRNPHYGCIASLDEPFRKLAAMFSDKAVFFTNPDAALGVNAAALAPSITLECGPTNEANEMGITHTVGYIEALMRVTSFGDVPSDLPLTVLKSMARVCLHPDASFAFEGEAQADSAAIVLRKDIDALNFVEQSPGVLLGWCRERHAIWVEPTQDEVPVEGLLSFGDDGVLTIGQVVTPTMLTRDPGAIRQDCLGYLMRRAAGI